MASVADKRPLAIACARAVASACMDSLLWLGHDLWHLKFPGLDLSALGFHGRLGVSRSDTLDEDDVAAAFLHQAIGGVIAPCWLFLLQHRRDRIEDRAEVPQGVRKDSVGITRGVINQGANGFDAAFLGCICCTNAFAKQNVCACIDLSKACFARLWRSKKRADKGHKVLCIGLTPLHPPQMR